MEGKLAGDMVPGHVKGGECLLLVDLIIQNVGTECSDMKAKCFPGNRMGQLPRVIENRDLGGPDSRYPCGYKQFKKNWKSRLCHGRCLRSCKYGEN